MNAPKHAALDAAIKAIEILRSQAWDAHDAISDSLADDEGHIDNDAYNANIDRMNDAYAAAEALDAAYEAAIDAANETKSTG